MMKMKHIAERAQASQQLLSNIIHGRRRPSWKLAKRFAQATDTDPVLWLEGRPEQIREAVEKALNSDADA